jgi:hypothetical protein
MMSRTRRLELDIHGTGVKHDVLCTFVNPGEWFKKRWLVGVGAGFDCLFYIVEADHEGDAIDALVDSEWGHIVKTDDTCQICEDMETRDIYQRSYDNCSCDFAGNYGERVDLDDIRVLRRI